MGGLREGRASIRQDHGLEIAHMRGAHGRGHTTIGHDPTDKQGIDPRLAQAEFHARLIKGGIGDLFHREIGGLQFIDQRMAPATGCEIPLA